MVHEEGRKYGYYINPDKCTFVVAGGSSDERVAEVRAALYGVPLLRKRQSFLGL
jgi:hypothetical protein